MALIRWIFSLSVLSVWGAFIGTALYVVLYQPQAAPPESAAIVVLAGGPGPGDQGLGVESRARFETGLALFESGAARLLVLSGGGTPPVAEFMADEARTRGVPEDALLIENRSNSTLQNALFTSDFDRLDKSAPIILVTHRYHLPRARASFRWAGFADVTSYAADPAAEFELSRGLLWESLKWPLNVLPSPPPPRPPPPEMSRAKII